jgi:signal transduction histidine kinase
MLNTIRAKFAAVLLAGLVLTILALSKGVSSGFGEPALIASSLMLVVMLLVERIVINPITRLTRDVVLIAKGDPSDPMNRLAVKGPEEVATLARTFNVFIAHLGARQELEQRLEHMAHHDALTNLPNRLR